MRKKLFILLLSVFTVFLFTACGTEDVNSGNQGQGDGTTNQEETTDSNEEPTEEVFNPVESLETLVNVAPMENEAVITISLKNSSEKDAKVTFTSGQRYDFVVKNEADQDVYSFSIDKSFIQAIEEMELKAGDVLEWKETWDYSTNAGERLPAGTYKIVASVVASEVNGHTLEQNMFQTETPNFEIPAGNNAFRNVNVIGEDGEYVVTGEARVFEASFFYSVEDGHDYVVEETVYTADEGAPAWGAFEIKISIPKEKLPINGALILQLYERSAKDGSIINTYHTQLQLFN